MLHRSIVLRLVFPSSATGQKTVASAQRHRKRSFLSVNTAQRVDPHTRKEEREEGDSEARPNGSKIFSNVASVSKEDGLSQRGRWRLHKEHQDAAFDGSPHSILNPTGAANEHARRQVRSALPADMYETSSIASRSSERTQRLRDLIARNTVSTIDVTSGGEADIELGGLPSDAYHGKDGWTTVPEASAMFQNVVNKNALPSRVGTSSWGVIRQSQLDGSSVRGGDANRGGVDGSSADVPLQEHSESDRSWALHNGTYKRSFDDSTALEAIPDAVSNSRSTYALRKLFLDGMHGYLGMITPFEELRIAEEAMALTQSASAAYIAEEARYCVNLFESRLGVPNRDPLAFAISTCPTLAVVLQRFVDLKLIPCFPNVIQISEMVGSFSGYPLHRKQSSIGPYLGLLNLVSSAVLHLQHVEQPWAPRIAMLPRSLFVVEQPCLLDYAMGYRAVHQPFHSFDYATRLSKDYRIEVMFAAVEVDNSRLLRESVSMTEYAAARGTKLLDAPRRDGGEGATGGHAQLLDAVIEQVKNSSGDAAKSALRHAVGAKAKPLTPSTPKSRMEELKARHKALSAMMNETPAEGRRGTGGTVIAGHRPGPRKADGRL